MEALAVLVSKFVPIDDFIENYDTNLNALYQNKHIGIIPSFVFITFKRGETFIDEEFFIRRVEFRNRVWLESHDMYFFLTKHNSRVYIAELLHKIDDSVSIDTWNSFLHTALFRSPKDSILFYQVRGLAMKFYRYARWLIRALFIKTRVPLAKRDINIILDRY